VPATVGMAPRMATLSGRLRLPHFNGMDAKDKRRPCHGQNGL
jgi:hypothetical protein